MINTDIILGSINDNGEIIIKSEFNNNQTSSGIQELDETIIVDDDTITIQADLDWQFTYQDQYMNNSSDEPLSEVSVEVDSLDILINTSLLSDHSIIDLLSDEDIEAIKDAIIGKIIFEE